MESKQKNLIFIVLILVAVLFYTLSGGSVGVSLDFQEDALILSGADLDWNIPYAEIQSLELIQLSDMGNVVDGIEKRTLHCGLWKNEQWNEYTLCINPKLDRGIVLGMADGEIIVFNYESNQSTEELLTMFTNLLHSKGR